MEPLEVEVREFPFLIGKVLTQSYGSKTVTLFLIMFPFLIGKVLTKDPATETGQGHGDVSIPYR